MDIFKLLLLIVLPSRFQGVRHTGALSLTSGLLRISGYSVTKSFIYLYIIDYIHTHAHTHIYIY